MEEYVARVVTMSNENDRMMPRQGDPLLLGL